MTNFGIVRLLIYLAGIGASGMSFADLATFDTTTWEFDLHPFRLDEAVQDLVTFTSSSLATLAVWRGWRTKK